MVAVIFLEHQLMTQSSQTPQDPNQNPHPGEQDNNGMGLPPQDIFSILGLQDLPEDEKKVLLEKLEKVIQEQVIHLIVTQLSDDQCKDLNEKMDSGMDQMQVIEYLRDKIPNLEDQIRKLVEDFKEDLLAEVDDIRGQLADGKTPSPNPVTKRFQQGYTQSAKLAALPQEVKDHLDQLNQLIEQATSDQNYDQLMELMQQRKAIKEQYGIEE